jgi:hypothetical protein
MEALRQHRPSPAEYAVHRAGNAGADGHHAACEGDRVRRFDEQVGMRRLQRIVDEPEIGTRANAREAPFQCEDKRDASQRWHAGTELHRDMPGKARHDPLPAPVSNRTA